MRLNGYQIVSEISADLLDRARLKAIERSKQYDKEIATAPEFGDKLVSASKALRKRSQASAFFAGSAKKRFSQWEKENNRQMKNAADNIEATMKKHETERAAAAAVRKAKNSKHKKIALGLGIGTAAIGTAAYLKHKHDQKKKDSNHES